MHNNWKWRTNVKVTVWNFAGIPVVERWTHNVITRGGLTIARNAVLGESELTFQAVGVGAGADVPSEEDTELQDERIRVEIIRRETVGIDTALTTAYVAPSEANDFIINEIGWFGGDEADPDTIETGVLMSRVLFNHDKSALESVQIDRLDTFAEVT